MAVSLEDEWLAQLEAELKSRNARAEWVSKTRERDGCRLLDELEQMGERLLAGSRGPANAALATELIEARDWVAIDAIRLRNDLSHATVTALVYSRDPAHALELLEAYSRHQRARQIK